VTRTGVAATRTGVAVTRTGVAVPRAYGAVARPYGYVGVGVFHGPAVFYHPYYTFHPAFSISFGLWAGYPIAYPYSWGYYNPYYYAYPYPGYAYGYPAPSYPPPASAYPQGPPPQSNYPPESNYPPQQGSIGVQPPNEDQSDMGGVSFEITPSTAEVFIDGRRAGTVGQFTPSSQPLGLPSGRHRVEIRAPGYKTMDVDIDIVAGQVIPYQGILER
jgi:hypothetical protein